MVPTDQTGMSDGDSVPAMEYSDGSVSGPDNQEDADGSDKSKQPIAKGGVTTPFPWKLHEMLDDTDEKGEYSVVRWLPHGRAFMVHKPKEFVDKIMHHYFNQTKYASFQRQLNLYGFSRLCHGKDKGAYYHDCFVRGERELCRGMIRQKIKGTKVRRSLSAEEEPNFYSAQYNSTKSASPMVSKPVQDQVPPSVPLPAIALEPHPALLKPKPKSEVVRSPPSRPVPRKVPRIQQHQPPPTQKQARSPSLPTQAPCNVRTQVPCSVNGAFQVPCNVNLVGPPAMPMPVVTLKHPMVKPAEVTPSTSLVSLMGHVTETRRGSNTPVVLPPLPPIRGLPPTPISSIPQGRPLATNQQQPPPPTPQPRTVKGGDLLFFEGQPFRYLEHIEELCF